MTELSDVLRDALQGKSEADTVAAIFTAVQSHIANHPERYSVTNSVQLLGGEDPVLAAAIRVIAAIQVVLSGYQVQSDEFEHAIRMLQCMVHGYALLQTSGAFQWEKEPGESILWMIGFVDAGLAAIGGAAS